MNEEFTPAEGFIRYALHIGALELLPEGRLLKSGRLSPYFFNAGLFHSGGAQEVISFAYAGVIAQHFDLHPLEDSESAWFNLLYGPPYKGSMLVPAVAMQLSRMGFENTDFCSSRKEAKEHGEGGLLIGAPIESGSRVVIIDDVIADGGTKREAVELIERYGGTVAGLVIAFDRQERGTTGTESAVQEFSREYGVPVYSIATLSDLISALGEIKKLSSALLEKYAYIAVEAGEQENRDEILEKIIAYQKEYGVS